MEIELWNKDTKAIIDPMGAWVTSLSDELGDIFYPKRSFKTSEGTKKTRGGCHVCLPHFGPGGKSGLPQHGYGRQVPWDIVSQEDTAVTLSRIGGAEGYEGLRAVLSYQLAPQSFRCLLEVFNEGDAPLALAPAFHPYLATPQGATSVRINGERCALDKLGEVRFIKNGAMVCETGRRIVTIHSKAMSTWALWTDRLGEYICIEPTVSGFSFEKSDASVDTLAPHAKLEYGMEVEW